MKEARELQEKRKQGMETPSKNKKGIHKPGKEKADAEVKRGDKVSGVDVDGKKVSGIVTSVGGDGVTVDHKYHVEHGKAKKQSGDEPKKKPAKKQKITEEMRRTSEENFRQQAERAKKENPNSWESKFSARVVAAMNEMKKIDERIDKIEKENAEREKIGKEFLASQEKKKLGIRIAPKNGNGKGFAGSVAVGDTVTGKDQSGNSVTGKVSAKEQTGIVVMDGNGAAHFVEWESIKHMDKAVNDQDSIRMLYDKEAISPLWRGGDSGDQPEHCDNIDDLLKAAAAARGDFDAVSDEYAKRFSGLNPLLIKRSELKSMNRIKEKLREDYEKGVQGVYEPGPPEVYHCRSIRDTDGHTFTLNNVADVGRMLAAFEKDKRIIRIKNNFAKPSDLGYSDINMNIRLPNGTIAEIQLNTTANLVAKERYGHSLYEVWRTIKSDKNYSELADIMTEAQKTLYGLSNRDSKSGTYKLSDSVNEAIINGKTEAIFKEEHKEYADAVKPFIEKAIPLFNEAVEKGKIDEKTAGHFKDLVFRLKNA
jgi:hypothetical protein